MLAPWEKSYDKPRQSIKKQRHYFANKGSSSQSYGFSSSHVWMWELGHKEGWVPKNWCFWTVVLEKTLESPFDYKEIQPVNPKGNQSWIFIGRTDAKVPILWPPDVKSQLTGKDPDAGKDWRQEEKGTIEDEMVGWHHQLDGHEFEQTPGDNKGQGSLACCRSWGCKELDMTSNLAHNDKIDAHAQPPDQFIGMKRDAGGMDIWYFLKRYPNHFPCWSWSSNTLATWCKEPTHWERPWCWERLKAGGEGDDKGWDD